MKKLIALSLIASMTAAALMSGCGSREASGQEPAAEQIEEQTQEQAEEQAVEQPDGQAEDQAAQAPEEVQEQTADEDAGNYPAYVFTGENPYMQPIFAYFEENIKDDYPEADIFLPEFDIFREDASDPEDIRVWDNFWVHEYNYRGTTLMTMSGGSYPGCMHLKAAGDGYEVTKAEFLEDGDAQQESMKSIFSDDELTAAYLASEYDEMDVRSYAAHSYAEQTGLNIRAYQDYGWDPVQADLDDVDFAMDLQYPDVAGNWNEKDGSARMQIMLPDSGSTFQFDITTADDTGEDHYSIYGSYEMGSQTFWYWDCWLNDDSCEDDPEGCLVINEDNTITWNHANGASTMFERAE